MKVKNKNVTQPFRVDRIKAKALSYILVGLVWLFAYLTSAFAAPGDITTVAGGGFGDGAPVLTWGK